MGLQSNEFDQQKSTESILVQVVLRNVKIDNQRFKFKSKLLKYFLKKVEKLKVKLFKTFSLKPLRIIKLINLSKGNSNVFEYSDLLFLKQSGISTKLTEKNEVIVDWRRNKKFSTIKLSWGRLASISLKSSNITPFESNLSLTLIGLSTRSVLLKFMNKL